MLTFQSTHPRGVRPLLAAHMFHGHFVSIHAPVRGATKPSGHSSSRSTGFNPRTREGCDSLSLYSVGASSMFQSTHPRGVRRQAVACSPALHRFQSTHPRGVRLILCFDILCYIIVSIHAPARGATRKSQPLVQGPRVSIHAPARGATITATEIQAKQQVSIHAPARGATRAALPVALRCPCFNPRTREGCDQGRGGGNLPHKSFNPRTREGCDAKPTGLYTPNLSVSIHAPARGATWWRSCTGPIKRCFNPRTREGCDRPSQRSPLSVRVFQSTHPRGVRPPIRASVTGMTRCFNPRTREGCDYIGICVF